MSQKIKSISLGFENCEDISIDKEYIYMLYFDNVAKGIYYNRPRDEICKYLTCEEFILELSGEADKPYESFGYPSEHTVFQRILLCRDITSVEICYDNGTSELIYVLCDGIESNTFQTSCIKDSGHLLVCISRDKTVQMFE